MARVRRALKDLVVEDARRRRKCHHNPKHSVAMGELCLVIRNPNGEGQKNYCTRCALEILDAAEDDLERLRSELL